MAFEWWNGSAWVGTETFVAQTSTTFVETLPADGELKLQIAVEDDTGAKSNYSPIRTIRVGLFSGDVAVSLPTLIQHAPGTHTPPPGGIAGIQGQVAQVVPW